MHTPLGSACHVSIDNDLATSMGVNAEFCATFLSSPSTSLACPRASSGRKCRLAVPRSQMYHVTTKQKIGNLLRAMLAQCTAEAKGEGHLFNTFHTYRSDEVVKALRPLQNSFDWMI